MVLLFIRFKKSLRDFCSESRETKWKSWSQLKKNPTRSTLHHWFKYFSLNFLRKFIEKTLLNLNSKIVAIDISGINSESKSSYYIKH
ncbi:MAG: hypothetical protein ACLFPL_00410 [Candidatus Nanoarchaeia archaeon]